MIVRFNEEQYKTIWVLSGLKIHSSPKYFIFGTLSREIDDAIYPRVVITDWKNPWLAEWILSKEMDSDDHSFTNLKWRLVYHKEII